MLLKNDGNQLPLAASALSRIAVIGGHADAAVLSGGGSGNTRDPVSGSFAGCGGLTFGSSTGCSWWRNPWLKVDVPIVAAIRALAPAAQVTYAGNSDQQSPFRAYTQQEIDQAAALAGRSDVAIVVVAQPAGEDFGDLQSLSLANPSNQDALVEAVARANPHTIVVVQSGNPVLMPWKEGLRDRRGVVSGRSRRQGDRERAVRCGQSVGQAARYVPARDQDSPAWGKTVHSTTIPSMRKS